MIHTQHFRLATRDAAPSDIPLMKELIFTHGVNPWNSLPEEGITRHLDGIASGETLGLLGFDGELLVGVVTCSRHNPYSHYEPPGAPASESGYIAEGVVAREHVGRGVGSYLLELACNRLREMGVRRIYVNRHEENRASAGALRKAGFREIATFDDFEKRPTGSRRTTVCRLDIDSKCSEQE